MFWLRYNHWGVRLARPLQNITSWSIVDSLGNRLNLNWCPQIIFEHIDHISFDSFYYIFNVNRELSISDTFFGSLLDP
jgi:hypothetical protein